MSSNMKLNWANSSPFKLWKPHGRKRSISSLKIKILNFLKIDKKYLRVIWAFWSQWHNQFAIWNYNAKIMITLILFLLFYGQSTIKEDGGMESVGEMSECGK